MQSAMLHNVRLKLSKKSYVLKGALANSVILSSWEASKYLAGSFLYCFSASAYLAMVISLYNGSWSPPMMWFIQKILHSPSSLCPCTPSSSPPCLSHCCLWSNICHGHPKKQICNPPVNRPRLSTVFCYKHWHRQLCCWQFHKNHWHHHLCGEKCAICQCCQIMNGVYR